MRVNLSLASIGLAIVSACSPRIKTVSAVVTPELPVVARLHPATSDANARVEVRISARVRNTTRDTLRIYFGCDDPPMTLEYLANDRWHWYLDQYLVNACAIPYTELTLAPGDTVTLRPTLAALRQPGPGGAAWMGPLPGQYRVRVGAYACSRNGRHACWYALLSAPFTIDTLATR